MGETAYPDIIPLIKHLCIALGPFAASRQIQLRFTTDVKKICLDYEPGELLSGFSKLLCSIMDYMPAYNMLSVQTALIVKDNHKHLSIKIHNTGINLTRISALTNNGNIPVSIHSSTTNETTFIIYYPLSLQAANIVIHQSGNSPVCPNFPLFFTELRRTLQSHLANTNNPVARLMETNPKEAAFLARINHCILHNIDKEGFDANALSTAMAISRAQLLRNLKSLIGISPGCYIRSLRLQKAKELLETSDLSVSEVTYKTGFQSPSHFTKVFTQKYGIPPSLFRRRKPHATNE